MNVKQNSPPKFDWPHASQSSPIFQENLYKNNPLEDYISKENFMSHFGIKRGLYYKLLNKGSIKVYHVGSKSFLKISEIDKALKENQLK